MILLVCGAWKTDPELSGRKGAVYKVKVSNGSENDR